ncbi:unnamed protein product [Phaedon cochleariae]|uniref:Uncharacterized protein n=1 Tax=Phaedon cochleariae TaxID=80249 RepID=A0A9P0DD16_PHACE|nr:unnamed protein product [Phaedon cochleariae]
MKLVIVPILLALASNGVYGVSVENYDASNDHHSEGLQNYGYGDGQNLGNAGYNGQEQGGYQSNDIGNHQALISESALGHQGGAYGDGGHLPQWQGGFQASQGIGEEGQYHSAIADHSQDAAGQLSAYGADHGLNYGGHEFNSDSHGLNLDGHDYSGGDDYVDLKPKIQFEHHHIPTKTIEKTEVEHIPVVKKIGVPVPHPVGVPTPQVIKVPVPQPYAVHVPVPHPIEVPIYKLVPQEIEKKVPIEVEKLVPVYVEKPFKIEIEKHHVEYVDKPYPVHIPVYKHIYHHVPKHGSGGHSEGH